MGVGSTPKVKDFTTLISQRSDVKGYERVVQVEKKYNSMNQEEQDEVANILRTKPLQYGFIKLQAKDEERKQTVAQVENELQNVLQSNAELKEVVMSHVQETKQFLHDVMNGCPSLLDDVSRLVLKVTQEESKRVNNIPLMELQRNIVVPFEQKNKLTTLNAHEKKI